MENKERKISEDEMMGRELYNVALFIDYENVYKNLLEEKRNAVRDGFFEKIREWCKKRNRRLVKIADIAISIMMICMILIISHCCSLTVLRQYIPPIRERILLICRLRLMF